MKRIIPILIVVILTVVFVGNIAAKEIVEKRGEKVKTAKYDDNS